MRCMGMPRCMHGHPSRCSRRQGTPRVRRRASSAGGGTPTRTGGGAPHNLPLVVNKRAHRKLPVPASSSSIATPCSVSGSWENAGTPGTQQQAGRRAATAPAATPAAKAAPCAGKPRRAHRSRCGASATLNTTLRGTAALHSAAGVVGRQHGTGSSGARRAAGRWGRQRQQRQGQQHRFHQRERWQQQALEVQPGSPPGSGQRRSRHEGPLSMAVWM